MEAPRTAQESSRRSAEATVAFGALAGCLTLAIVVVWVAARTGDVVPAARRGGAKPILVTGFRAFNGEENPSSVCARRLNGTRAPSGRLIYSTLLSVDGRGAGVAAARLDAYAAVVRRPSGILPVGRLDATGVPTLRIVSLSASFQRCLSSL